MSSRAPIKPFPVITNGDMSGTVTSLVTIPDNTTMISYDISFTGAPMGSFSVQVSNTYTTNAAGQPANPGDWVALPLSTTPTISAAGNGMIDVQCDSFHAIRLVYTPTSGSGVLNATVVGKVR